MIRFFDKKDEFAIIAIWQEAFGDSKEYIISFLEFQKDNILVFELDGKVVSMLTLLPVFIGKDKGRYVYAVATDKAFRNKGYAGELIKYAKKFISENDEQFLVLLPQEESLYNFYKKYGFSELFCAKNISVKIDLNKTNKQKAEIISAYEYFSLRKLYFKGQKFVEWGIDCLEFIKKAYRGNFFVIKDDNKVLGAAFCYKVKGKLVVAELLSKANELENLNALGEYFGIQNVECISARKDGNRFAMVYPFEYSDSYFGLGMK